MGARSYGSHNTGQWQGVPSPTPAEAQRVWVNGHDGRYQIENTEDAGPNASTGSKYANNSIYRANASGYNASGSNAGADYGGWYAFPVHGSFQYDTMRIWNWGHSDLYIKSACVVHADTVSL
jgi:hypothetical protein